MTSLPATSPRAQAESPLTPLLHYQPFPQELRQQRWGANEQQEGLASHVTRANLEVREEVRHQPDPLMAHVQGADLSYKAAMGCGNLVAGKTKEYSRAEGMACSATPQVLQWFLLPCQKHESIKKCCGDDAWCPDMAPPESICISEQAVRGSITDSTL